MNYIKNQKERKMNLFWTDVKNNKYLLGNLYKKDDYFYFDINETELKQAILHGCFGIGTINTSDGA